MADYVPPRIVTRAEWLARPPRGPIPARSVDQLKGTVVHHEAARPSLTADPAELVAQIQRYHMDVNGWSDIAYNSLVWHDGTVLLGRDAAVRGAHTVAPGTLDWNVTSLGVCILGDGDDPNYVTDAAWSSVLWLWGVAVYVTKGVATGLWTHHETGSATHCAGTETQAKLDGLRAWLAAGMPQVTE